MLCDESIGYRRASERRRCSRVRSPCDDGWQNSQRIPRSTVPVIWSGCAGTFDMRRRRLFMMYLTLRSNMHGNVLWTALIILCFECALERYVKQAIRSVFLSLAVPLGRVSCSTDTQMPRSDALSDTQSLSLYLSSHRDERDLSGGDVCSFYYRPFITPSLKSEYHVPHGIAVI